MATVPLQVPFEHVHSQHPMTLLHLKPGTASKRFCEVCGHRISLGWYYQCAPCDFNTHILCAAIVDRHSSANAPPQTQFEYVHSQHPMTLLYQKPDSIRNRECDVCGQLISSGLYYQCAPCQFDAHLVCAFISNYNPPDSHTSAHATKLFERIHDQHRMTLLSTTNGNRSCDVCGYRISSGQYYQCAVCDFDAHFLCATAGNIDPFTSSPAATPGSRSGERMTSSAPTAPVPTTNTCDRSAEPTWKNGVETYTTVASAVDSTMSVGLNLGKAANWVTEQETGMNIFDHCRDALNAPSSGSVGDTSGAYDYGAAGDTSGTGFGLFDIFNNLFG